MSKLPRKSLSALVALCCTAMGCGLSVIEGAPPAGAASVERCSNDEVSRLADGVYSFQRGLYSTMFVLGRSGGVVVVDPLGQEAECLGRAIQVTAPGQRVEHVIYTHSDSDHIAGATRLPLSPGVKVYAHKHAVQDLQRNAPNPEILQVTDELDVNQDGSGQPLARVLLGRMFHFSYFGPTRGSGNLMIYLPEEKVAMLVDVLMADAAPGTVLAGMSPQGVLRTLSKLDQLSFHNVVVGHGPPALHADVTRTLEFWSAYVARAQSALLKVQLTVPSEEALTGSPMLHLLPQFPVKDVLDSLRPSYGGYPGFDRWGDNGFNFAYLFLRSESPEPVMLRTVDIKGPPTRWEKVGGVPGGPSAYYAQVGTYGSLVFDPDPQRKGLLVVVDSLGEHAAYLRRLLLQNLPGRRVGHIIYSHGHNDHIAHASALCDGDLSGVTIYAHENAARDLRDRKNPTLASPNRIIRGTGEDLEIDGQIVSLRSMGPGHSDGSLVVHLPALRVAMAVDLIEKGAMPGLTSVEMDAAGLLRTLTGLAGLGAEVYLTGHGGWMDLDEMKEAAAAARDLLGSAAAAMKTGEASKPHRVGTPVAPALRGVVEQVGQTVAKSLGASHPGLRMGPQAGYLGELGVTYCSAQSSSLVACELR